MQPESIRPEDAELGAAIDHLEVLIAKATDVRVKNAHRLALHDLIAEVTA